MLIFFVEAFSRYKKQNQISNSKETLNSMNMRFQNSDRINNLDPTRVSNIERSFKRQTKYCKQLNNDAKILPN